MTTQKLATAAVEYIHKQAPGFKPKFGLILGSGMSSIADSLQESIRILYQDIPGFQSSRVTGHRGELCLGYWQKQPVACMQGRTHLYEGQPLDAIRVPIRTLKLLGCDILITTNAVATIRQDIQPGSLFVVNDHINLQFSNPLVGENEEFFGPRFPSLEEAYDPSLRNKMLKTATQLGIQIAEGVFIAVLGPSYETPAEINAFRIWGADVVGMSTVPEVIIARHCGLKVVTVSIVTNRAAGTNKEKITHEEVLHIANQAADNLSRLLSSFVGNFGV